MGNWIVSVVLVVILGLLFLTLLALLRANEPDEVTRRLDDEEQIEYLRRWKEHRELKHKRRGRRRPCRTDRS